MNENIIKKKLDDLGIEYTGQYDKELVIKLIEKLESYKEKSIRDDNFYRDQINHLSGGDWDWERR